VGKINHELKGRPGKAIAAGWPLWVCVPIIRVTAGKPVFPTGARGEEQTVGESRNIVSVRHVELTIRSVENPQQPEDCETQQDSAPALIEEFIEEFYYPMTQ
jgi:hypothetical protein